MKKEERITVNEISELKFEPKTHTYKLNDKIIPSVSSIMVPLSSAKYKGIREDTLDRAAAKGTAVHNAIENYIKFEIDDAPPEHRGYFEAFLNWWNDKKPEVVSSEFKVYHKILEYGGTIDLLVYLNGVLTLVDVKTTATLSDMTCGVQLEAYSQALKSQGIIVEKKIILHLKKDGKYAEREYPVSDPVRWRVFGSLKCVYDYIESA